MKIIVLTVLIALGAVSSAQAQVMVHGVHGPIVVPSHGQSVTVFRPQHVQHPTISHQVHHQPSGPAIVSSNQVSSIDPLTGAINTSNVQIDHSTFAPGRAESMNNGTKRWVTRPIHNSFGQVVGYQQGWVWNNSMTGQEHGNLQNFTPNGSGGMHVQHQTRSRRSSSSGVPISSSISRPQGIHTQFHNYSRGQ